MIDVQSVTDAVSQTVKSAQAPICLQHCVVVGNGKAQTAESRSSKNLAI